MQYDNANGIITAQAQRPSLCLKYRPIGHATKADPIATTIDAPNNVSGISFIFFWPTSAITSGRLS